MDILRRNTKHYAAVINKLYLASSLNEDEKKDLICRFYTALFISSRLEAGIAEIIISSKPVML